MVQKGKGKDTKRKWVTKGKAKDNNEPWHGKRQVIVGSVRSPARHDP